MAVLRLVRHARRRGQSAALLSGVRAARGPWIATLDGDGQNDPADIPALLAARDKAAESGQALQLIGGRRVNRRDRWLKRFSSKVANAVRRRLLGDATPDTGCGLKLFPRAAFLALPHFDHFHRFLPALIQRQGGAVISVDVSHRPRRAGRSHYGVFDRLWVGLFDLVGVMWLQRRAMGPDDPGAGAPKE
jgi:dolichol-phosphate mannosyltransferase